MAKGIIVLDEIPKSCVDCPMYYHAEDMSLGKWIPVVIAILTVIADEMDE